MAYTIAVAGKGGTGKTTTAALMVRALHELGARSVLAVDADPNACLHESLGTQVERSVGEITEEMLQNAESNPGGMTKDAWIEYNIQMYVVEESEFDLLSMGRPEGSGCYCYANNLVKGCMSDLQESYEYVVMDNEAGLEHLSRRTTRNVDLLLMVADASVRGIRTAASLNQLADELKVAVGARFLIVNRAEEPLDPALHTAIDQTGVPLLGTVPNDQGITRCDLEGCGVFSLPDDSPALCAVSRMLAHAIPALGASPDPVRC
jgi:CO dehydrogenase maturation factor